MPTQPSLPVGTTVVAKPRTVAGCDPFTALVVTAVNADGTVTVALRDGNQSVPVAESVDPRNLIRAD